MSRPALGLIETTGIGGAIAATHAASKSGQVVIVSAERTRSDCVTVKIEGNWGEVQVAVEAGARAADEAGELISMHVIPQTDNGVSLILPYQRFVERYGPDTALEQPAETPLPAQPKKPKKPAVAPRPQPPVLAEQPQTARLESEIIGLDSVLPIEKPTEVAAKKPLKPKAAAPPPQVTESSPAASPEAQSMAELEKMPVVKLRKYARTVANLPIKGREISKANKQQLLEVLKTVLG